MDKPQAINFEISISGRDDGTIEAMYIQIFNGEVHHTKEILEDTLLADYADDGRIVGIEVLAPVRISDIKALVLDHELNERFAEFVERATPRDLVVA